jgi:hypothetical protein
MARTQSQRRTWGGYRPGSGAKIKRPGEHLGHRPRPLLAAGGTVKVTLRVLPGISSLRGARCLPVLRRCFEAGKRKPGFRLEHFAVESDRIELTCEAEDARALSRALQGLTIRIARRLNHALGRKGQLFAERYQAEIVGKR